MPLPDDTCLELEIDLAAMLSLSIDLPGGVALQAKLEAGAFPNLGALVNSVLEPLNAALTPLMPFFRLLDVVLAIIDCIKAIPDSLGPPPDPTLLFKCLKKLLKAVSKLLSLIPPLSIPIMIVGCCRVVIAALMALIEQLEHILTVQASLDIARDKAATLALDLDLAEGAANLEASIDCAQANLDLQMEANSASLGPINKFLELLNAFAGLAGLPEFLSIEAGGDASAMLQPLKDAVAALSAVCNSIPV
jgi:hypothetical protein